MAEEEPQPMTGINGKDPFSLEIFNLSKASFTHIFFIIIIITIMILFYCSEKTTSLQFKASSPRSSIRRQKLQRLKCRFLQRPLLLLLLSQCGMASMIMREEIVNRQGLVSRQNTRRKRSCGDWKVRRFKYSFLFSPKISQWNKFDESQG